MKKTKLWTLLVATIVFMVGIFTVEAASNIEATGISIKDQSSTMTVEDPVLNNGEITSNITFKEVGDYVLFDVTLKNNKSSEYKIKSVTDNNENESIEIEYDYDEKIGVGGTGSLKIKMTYKNASDQDVNIEDLVITIEEEDGSTDKVIVNPKTSDNILKYLLLLIISVVAIVLIVMKKKGSKTLLLAMVSLLMIPTIVFASEKFTLKFIDIEVKAIPKTYVINYDPNGGSGEMAPQEMTYDVKANLTENAFTYENERFKEWNTKKDGSGDSYGDGAEVENLTTDAEITLYAQWEKYALLDTGNIINTRMKNLANDTDTYIEYYDSDYTIDKILKADSLPDGFTPSEGNTISLDTSTEPVYIYWDQDNNVMYWYTEADVMVLNSDSAGLFSTLGEVDEIEFIDELDTSSATTMRDMFSSVTITDYSGLSDWDVSSVTDMSGMFYGDELDSTDFLAKWDTGNVEDMSYMFCYVYGTDDFSGLSGLDTGSVTTMENMFEESTLTDLTPLANWDVTNVENMAYMFFYCYDVEDLTPLSGWVTTSLKQIDGLFASSGILSLDGLEEWDISHVTSLNSTFNAYSLEDIDAISDWDVSNVIRMNFTFSGAAIENADALASWETSSLIQMRGIFYIANNLVNADSLRYWDVSKVTDMESAFSGCSNLESVDFMNYWDTSSVDDIRNMFFSCEKISGSIRILNQPSDYSGMFSKAATESGKEVYVNYTANVTNIDDIVATKSSNSNVFKGNLITE